MSVFVNECEICLMCTLVQMPVFVNECEICLMCYFGSNVSLCK